MGSNLLPKQSPGFPVVGDLNSQNGLFSYFQEK